MLPSQPIGSHPRIFWPCLGLLIAGLSAAAGAEAAQPEPLRMTNLTLEQPADDNRTSPSSLASTFSISDDESSAGPRVSPRPPSPVTADRLPTPRAADAPGRRRMSVAVDSVRPVKGTELVFARLVVRLSDSREAVGGRLVLESLGPRRGGVSAVLGDNLAIMEPTTEFTYKMALRGGEHYRIGLVRADGTVLEQHSFHLPPTTASPGEATINVSISEYYSLIAIAIGFCITLIVILSCLCAHSSRIRRPRRKHR